MEKITPLLEELETSLHSVAAATVEASGTLRLNVPSSASRMVLQPLLQGFLRKHPGINREVAVDNALVDIVATPGYLQGRKLPTHPHDLLEHECVNYRSAQTGLMHRWDFEKDGTHAGHGQGSAGDQ